MRKRTPKVTQRYRGIHGPRVVDCFEPNDKTIGLTVPVTQRRIGRRIVIPPTLPKRRSGSFPRTRRLVRTGDSAHLLLPFLPPSPSHRLSPTTARKSRIVQHLAQSCPTAEGPDLPSSSSACRRAGSIFDCHKGFEPHRTSPSILFLEDRPHFVLNVKHPLHILFQPLLRAGLKTPLPLTYSPNSARTRGLEVIPITVKTYEHRRRSTPLQFSLSPDRRQGPIQAIRFSAQLRRPACSASKRERGANQLVVAEPARQQRWGLRKSTLDMRRSEGHWLRELIWNDELAPRRKITLPRFNHSKGAIDRSSFDQHNIAGCPRCGIG